MIIRITLLWILGLATVVPYALYRLFFLAEREEYAFLIVISLFWVFGFWGVVGPLVAAYRIHKLMKALDKVKSAEEAEKLLTSPESEALAVELIATENHLPEFLVRIFLRRGARLLVERERQGMAAVVAGGETGVRREPHA